MDDLNCIFALSGNSENALKLIKNGEGGIMPEPLWPLMTGDDIEDGRKKIFSDNNSDNTFCLSILQQELYCHPK
jgi:hypothetical protein